MQTLVSKEIGSKIITTCVRSFLLIHSFSIVQSTGDNISMTRGIVSRIELSSYVHGASTVRTNRQDIVKQLRDIAINIRYQWSESNALVKREREREREKRWKERERKCMCE